MNKPVAIVGFAFRLPGSGVDGLWSQLMAGEDLVTEVPDDRWSKEFYWHPDKTEPGRAYTFAAGTLGDIRGFDAGFFGISPREAEKMDPQQRLLLEMTWECLESGGLRPSRLRGSNTAVFLGYSGTDYSYRWTDDLAVLGSTTMTGNTGSVAANRLSYCFDLRGPSMSVDTACSSSLVAVHQAWQSIQAGEVDQAIAGGITLHMHPFPFVGFSKASMLSPNGRCRVFDADGDGYVRSEGGGVFLLQDLEKAQAEGNQIFAVIAGSGVNCDGDTNGITVPGKETQADLLRSVYQRAGIEPAEVDYLETHGTGTAVGDPIETAAVAEVLAKDRPSDKPLFIGSVKSNLGHLETASGVAGLVKAIFCIQHRQIPPNLHFDSPNPRIPFNEWNLRVVTEPTSFPTGKALIVGVNSFGFGGANAHVVLSEAPDVGARIADARQLQPDGDESEANLPPLFLSAKSRPALKALAARYAKFLNEQPDTDLYGVAYNAYVQRDTLAYNCLADTTSRRDLINTLEKFASGDAPAGLTESEELANASRPVFVFTGNGSQWVGMGQALLRESTVFHDVVRTVDRLFVSQGGESIVADLERAAGESRYALTEVAQPALFAIQVGIVEVLRSWGITPGAVIGHSVGEVAAAWAAGAIDLAQAVEVVHQRSFFQAETRGTGCMVAAALTANEVQDLLDELGCSDQVAIAGFNSPRGVTLAGEDEALSTIERRLAERELFYRRLPLDYAFHSPAMEPIKEPLLKSLRRLSPSASRIPFCSTVTGSLEKGEALDAFYWWRNIREPVQFAAGLSALIDDGFNVFVEVGPHALLRNYVNDCLRSSSTTGRVVTTLLRDDDGLHRLRSAWHTLLLLGGDASLPPLFPRPAPFINLPHYPWQRDAYWMEATSEGSDIVNRRSVHPLLGYPVRQLEGCWENLLDLRIYPALADHKVGDAVLFPAAGFIETLLAAAIQTDSSTFQLIEDIEIRAPLLLEENSAKQLRTTLDDSDGRLRIESRSRLSKDAWLLNGVARMLGGVRGLPSVDPLVVPSRPHDVSSSRHYHLTDQVGLEYGVYFQTVGGVWMEGDGAIAELAQIRTGQTVEDFVLSPFLLDGCFQLLVDHLSEEMDFNTGMAFVPVQVRRLIVRSERCDVAFVRSRIAARGPRSLVADFVLYDRSCQPVADLSGVRFRGVRLRRDLLDHTRYLQCRLVPEALPGKASTGVAPGLSRAVAAARSSLFAPSTNDSRIRFYDEVEPLLDALCAAFASETLKRLTSNDDAFSPAALLSSGKVESASSNLLMALCKILEDDGLLEPTVDGFRWVPDVGLPEPSSIWLSLLGDYPDHAAEVMLAGRSGRLLYDALIGNLDQEARSQRVCASNTLTQYIGGSPTLRRVDGSIGQLVDDLLKRRPAFSRKRVLVLSGCQSRVAATIANRADFACCDVVLATGDPDAIVPFDELIDHNPAAEAYTVDLGESPRRWELGKSSPFDLLILGGVINQLPDSLMTLTDLRQLCCPGGVLAVVEQQSSRWSDLVFGLNPDWWHKPGGQIGFMTMSTPEQTIEQIRTAGWSSTTVLADHPDSGSGPFIVLADPATKATSPDTNSDDRHFLLVHDRDGYSAALAEILERTLSEAGCRVQRACRGGAFTTSDNQYAFDPGSPDQAEKLVSALQQDSTPSDLVWLAGLEPELDDFGSSEALVDLQVSRCSALAHMVQAFGVNDLGPDFWLITSGATPFEIPGLDLSSSSDLAAGSGFVDSTLWGFARSLMNEVPFGIRLIDLAEPQKLERMSVRLVDELMASSAEDEVVLSADGRFVTRLRPRGAIDRERSAEAMTDRRVALDFALPGPLKGLRWKDCSIKTTGRDEVLIEVKAAGLNFRDVMYAMGLLSDEAVESGFAGPTLGMELSGVVVTTGSDVDEFQPGDSVVAFAPASFANLAVTSASAVVHKPNGWSFEAAATVPTTFFTSYYALVHLAQLSQDERVLIHGAAGGVGIAAVQIAKALGAEIFATAGSHEKRDFVRLLGADHVLDSRSLDFSDEILALTDGQGVDVVLNSLAGEAINRNFGLLRPFGRFLELGKRDFYENSRIGLRPFRNNISYFGIDADQLMSERPDLTRRLFRSMMGLFADGTLKPLPYRVFAAEEVVEAFRYMQQSKQIGKVVVSFAKPPEAVVSSEETGRRLRLDPEATYLVTGGLAGFGARTAEWLAERGARHLALLSRSGSESAESQELLRRLQSRGVMTRAFACDVTDLEALNRVLSAVDATMPTLKGVVHAAMVIDDGLVRDLDETRIKKVFAPKAQGAFNLHTLTAQRDLEFFVLFSSATTLFGNPGQSSYVAANHFLEKLADHRRASGQTAVCVSWGAIDDAGYLARNETVKTALQSRMGGSALRASEALNALERLLLDDRSGVGVLDYEWAALQRHLPVAGSPRFSELARLAEGAASDGGDLDEIHRLVNELPEEELIEVFIEMMKKEVSEILHLPVERIDAQSSVYELGMDSLMGMELVVAVEARFGVTLPVMALSEGPAIDQIVLRIVRQMKKSGQTPQEGGEAAQTTAALAAQHGEGLDQEMIESIAKAVESTDGKQRGSLLR